MPTTRLHIKKHTQSKWTRAGGGGREAVLMIFIFFNVKASVYIKGLSKDGNPHANYFIQIATPLSI